MTLCFKCSCGFDRVPIQGLPSALRNLPPSQASVQMYTLLVLGAATRVAVIEWRRVSGECNGEEMISREQAVGTLCSQDFH